MALKFGTTWKRKHPRIKLELRGDYRVLNRDRHYDRMLTTVKTLGGGGMMIASSDPLIPGTPVQMRLFHYSSIITLNSRVVWVEPLKKNALTPYQVGLRFDPPVQASLLQIDFLIKNKS